MARGFVALRHRNFRLFWCGQLISLIGTWMQGLGQQWLVYVLTGSALKLGIVSAFDMPARQAFVVEMVGREDLMNAIALNSSIFNDSRVLGPAAGAYIKEYSMATEAKVLPAERGWR